MVKLPKRSKKTDKKPSKASKRRFFKRIRAPKYFRESWKELKKVTWPSRKDALKLSFAVVVFTIVFAIFTTIVDTGFSKLVERIFS